MHEGRHMLPEPVLGTTLADSSSADSFCKDGRKISVGDCALFRAGNSPPFIGIIRWLATSKENNYLKLGVNWLYRPADVKISKGILPKAAPNEVFYSFHKDEISAASLLHPCKVAFLHKSVELPSGISSFVCRRVYDIANKCLWWLTDHDYINERQKEVDQLLDKTRLEMHAAVQSGGRSPKPLNSPTSTAPLKSGSDNVENSSSSFSSQGSKNKNKERGNQGSDSIKQERSSKLDDGDSVHFRQESMIKAELANVIDKGGLINIEGVEKLVHFMQRDRAEKKIDLLGRVMLANLIAATERLDCLGHFVQLRGVSVLDDWLQEAHKGKIGEGSSPKESDKSVEELVVALLRALDKLPVNLLALQTCNVGKSVNNLRSHKNLEIQRKARSLVDTWKKRVDAEMKMNDAKIGMIQTVPWPGKAGFPEASHGGNRRPGPSAEAAGKCSSMQPSASKTTSVKFSHGDTVLKQTSSPVPVKLISSLPSSVTINSKGSDVQLATTKEEKSSSSSQSHNSQSCSSEHPKTVGSTWKEDPRSSTAGSISTNKRSSTGTSRSRRSSNGFIGSGFSVVKKEISNGKSGITNRNAQPDKVSQSEVTCERMLDMPVPDHANSHRLIVRLPNPGRSPARGATGGSFEDPSVTGRRASSPGIFEKQDPSDKKTKGKIESHQAGNNADMNTESWPRSDVKDEVAGSDEGERSPVAPPDEERGKITEELVKPMELSKSACSWRGGKKELLVGEHKTSKSHGSSFSPMNALIESCVKFSEAASASSSFRDDLGMNLLASVATGEMCNSETFLPIGSPRRNSPGVIGDKNNAMAGVSNANEIADHVPEKQDNDASPLHVKDESQQTSLRPVANNGSNNNNATGNSKNNLSSVQNKLAVAQNEQILASRIDLKSNAKPDEPSDNGCEAMSTCMEVDDTLTDVTKQGSEGEEAHLHEKKKASTSGDNSEEVIDSKTEGRTASLHENKMVDNAPETTVETTQYGVASDSVGGLMGEGSDVERAASCTEVEKKVVEESKPCPSILTGINIKLRDEVLIHHQPLPTVAANCLEALDRNEDFFAPPVSGIIKEPSKPENNEGMEVTSNSKPIDKERPEKSALGSKALDDRVGAGDMFEENSSEKKEVFKREQSPSELVQEHEPGVVSTGFMLSAVNADEMEDRVAAAAVSSTAVGSDTSGKLDFDLNEGFASSEGNNQGDTATSSAPGSSSVPKLPNMLPFSLSTMSTTVPPTSITVAAAAKGPFVPPENLLRSRGELGWKGSAATSAFRPAEPRKVLELLLNATDVSITDTDNMSSKQGRPPLEIDLNMPDERDPEDTASMRSVPEVGSELVPASNHASLQSTGGLNLDLNRLDEGTENGQFSASTSQRLELSHFPLKLSSPSSRFLNGQVNVLRDFDLNDGPVPEEAGAVEPAPSNQYRSKSNLQSVPPIPGLRVNNIELGSLSSWFPPGSCSYPAVSVPSFLTDRGGDPPYPIVGSSGAHQRLLGSAINGTFGGDLYRGPILSSTMPFNPTTAASFPYAGIPLGTSFPLASTSFAAGPTYMDTSSGGAGGPCFPAVPSQLVGPAVAVSSHYPRPYVIGLPEGSTSSGIAESNRKWGRHVLDLNAGPGSADVEGRDERFPSRQFSVASSQTSAEEQQARMYHAVKRKEPDGGWDAERFGYKQPSWH